MIFPVVGYLLLKPIFFSYIRVMYNRQGTLAFMFACTVKYPLNPQGIQIANIGGTSPFFAAWPTRLN